jgi:tRNA(Ile)-lysidine synthase
MYNTIISFVLKHSLINHNDTIIVGLSGGPDSVFLFHYLLSIKTTYNLTLIAAHLNHQWRLEADDEELFCKSLAEHYAIPFVSEKLSQLAHVAHNNGSKEAYARSIRRFFLESVAQNYSAQSIALGHHAQDQQETFFIRLIRGTSLTGLTCIQPRRGLYIRPLLEINKSDILEWLQNNTVSYVTDISNESEHYLRNRIRATVLPALQLCDERFNNRFLATIDRLQKADIFLQKVATTLLQDIVYKESTICILNTAKLAHIDSALHHYIIIQWLISQKVAFQPTESFLNEIIRFLLSNRGGTHHIHQQWSIVKKANRACINRSSQ